MSASLATRDTALLPPRAALRPRLTRRTLFAAAGLATLALTAWQATAWWRTGRFMEATDDAYIGGDITPLAPHVAGFVATVLVADNQFVHAGQPLIRLDARDFATARDRATAALAASAADFAAAQGDIAAERAALAEDEASRSAALADAAFTAKDAARYASLAVDYAGTRQDADRSSALAREKQESVNAAASRLAADRAKLAALQARLGAANAALAAARADLNQANLNLAYTEIRAPMDGYVANRAAEPGAYVPAGTYLLSVVPAQGLWVDANFKEDQLARMRVGDPVTVRADAYPGQKIPGRIESLAHGTGAVFSVIPPENATGNFTKIVQRVPVRIALDPPASGLVLRPGLSVTASADTRGTP